MGDKMDNYKYKLVKSPVQLYAVGIFWVLYALIFPLYLWYHYIAAIALAAAVYFIFGRIFPPKQVKITLPYKVPLSGISDVDKMLREADETLKRIEASRDKIAGFNPQLAGQISEIVSDGRKIMEHLSVNTQKSSLLRRFFNYYLPTLDKLLRSYIVFYSNGADTENAVKSMAEIEQAVTTMEDVFQKQLNKLLDDVALDITTDIDVLETMLENQNEINNGGFNTK